MRLISAVADSLSNSESLLLRPMPPPQKREWGKPLPLPRWRRQLVQEEAVTLAIQEQPVDALEQHVGVETQECVMSDLESQEQPLTDNACYLEQPVSDTDDAAMEMPEQPVTDDAAVEMQEQPVTNNAAVEIQAVANDTARVEIQQQHVGIVATVEQPVTDAYEQHGSPAPLARSPVNNDALDLEILASTPEAAGAAGAAGAMAIQDEQNVPGSISALSDERCSRSRSPPSPCTVFVTPETLPQTARPSNWWRANQGWQGPSRR